MARQGYYRRLQSTHPQLEVKSAGTKHICHGVFIERGARPGQMKDVWIVGRSRRCTEKIHPRDFYVANFVIPPYIMAGEPHYSRWFPTCMVCAIEFFGDTFSGEAVVEYLKPMTPERRKEIKQGLLNLLRDPGI